MEPLIAAGAAEVALGALLGFPYSMLVDDNARARRFLGKIWMNNPRRLRQLHLDLIMMGTLLMVAGAALPDLPTATAWAIGVGGWSNALLFVPLMVNEKSQQQLWFRAVTAVSFVAVAGGWVGVAAYAITQL